MKISVYLRSALRGLRQSAGQFIAITLIIFMGVLLFVGIKSVGPDLEATVQNYVDQHKVSDLAVTGTAGLTATDLELVQQTNGVQAELGHSFPFADEKKGLNLQVYSYTKKQQQNTLQLVKGAYPKIEQEILVDSALKKQYPIGSKLTITSDQLKQKEFKVTGFIESPLYVDRAEKREQRISATVHLTVMSICRRRLFPAKSIRSCTCVLVIWIICRSLHKLMKVFWTKKKKKYKVGSISGKTSAVRN